MSDQPVPKPMLHVHVTDLDDPESAYTAFSRKAALPEHREGFSQAIGRQAAIQLGKIRYEPRP